MVLVLAGFNDGSQGPLLPFLQDHYHVRLHSRADADTQIGFLKSENDTLAWY